MSSSDLKISSVTIKNFRTFYGEKKPLELSTDPKKPVTVIHGKNGKGKTSLINSIHWCIYGSEKSDDKQNSKLSEGLVHTFAIDSLEIGQDDEMFVRVELVDQNNQLESEITRKITFKKISNDDNDEWNAIIQANIPKSIVAESSVIYRWRDVDSDEMKTIDNDSEIYERIEKVFPKVLSSYVLFDAELLREFEKNNTEELIKEGIESITGLPLLKDAIKHISKENRKITSDNIAHKAEYRSMSDRIQQYELRIEKEQGAIKTNRSQIQKIQSQLKPIREFLIKHDDDAIKKQEEEIVRYENSQHRCRIGIRETKDRLKSIIFENLTNYLLTESHKITSQKFKVWESAGLMPTHFSKEALQSLLDDETCVCERPLKEKDEEYRKNIATKADNAPDTAAGKELGKIRNRVEELVSEVDESSSINISEQFKKLRLDLAEYRSELKICNTEISKRKSEFDSNLHDTVTSKLQERTKLEKDESRLVGENTRSQIFIDKLQPNLNKAKEDEVKMKKDAIKNEIIQNQIT